MVPLIPISKLDAHDRGQKTKLTKRSGILVDGGMFRETPMIGAIGGNALMDASTAI
jgi:hypothetical protein